MVNSGYLIGTAIFLSALIVLVVIQIAATKFHPFLYWSTIVASTTAGTTMADFATRSLGIGYTGGSLLLFACLMAVLGLWYWSLGSISVTTVNTPKVEAFYWAAITFSQTLGTALGDWIADAGSRLRGGALVFGAGLAVLAAAYFWTNVSRVLLFWAAFILTRPLGATVGDFLDKPLDHGGLALEPSNCLGGHRGAYDHARSRSASTGRQSSWGNSEDGIGAGATPLLRWLKRSTPGGSGQKSREAHATQAQATARGAFRHRDGGADIDRHEARPRGVPDPRS